MHLADALSKATYIAFKLQFYIYQLLLSLGIEPMILALLAPCSTIELQESLTECLHVDLLNKDLLNVCMYKPCQNLIQSTKNV